MIEIRDFGDGQTVVVYTNEREIADRLSNRKDCLKIIPYQQEQYSKKRVALIGLDYYLPRSQKAILRKALGQSLGH